MDERKSHLLKIRLRVYAKVFGGIALVGALFAGVFSLENIWSAASELREEIAKIQGDETGKPSGQMRLPPQFLTENPPLVSLKNSTNCQ